MTRLGSACSGTKFEPLKSNTRTKKTATAAAASAACVFRENFYFKRPKRTRGQNHHQRQQQLAPSLLLLFAPILDAVKKRGVEMESCCSRKNVRRRRRV
jgi:hypothetical protein